MTPLKCFIAANAYGRYCVPASSRHRPASAAILRGEVWEQDTLSFLTSHCAAGDVIHAGTYFGDFLPALSKALAPGAHIWAFEPADENFQCADITLKLNGLGNITLTRAALGAERGTAILRTGRSGGRRDGGGSRIVAERAAGFTYEAVSVAAIDDVVPADRMVSILQLDVEQYEQQALAGARQTIGRCRPLMVLETLPADGDWFADTILSLGYEEIGSLDKNRAFRVGT